MLTWGAQKSPKEVLAPVRWAKDEEETRQEGEREGRKEGAVAKPDETGGLWKSSQEGVDFTWPPAG